MRFILLVLVSALNFSCVEKKSTEQESNKSPIETNSRTDSLKFTSGIRAILHDSKGHYWFGSHSEGLSYFNGKSYEYYTTNEGLVDNRIRSIQEDTNGTIWIGTAMGVSAYAKGKFTNYLTNANKPIHNWNETIGDLWFYASEEDGIGRFDGLNLNYLVFPKPQGAHSDNSYGVTDIAEAKDGKVWIATYAALFSYDGQVVNTFDEDKLNLKKNDLLHIRSVFADSKGRIWVGNNGIGVVLIEGNTTIHFSEKNNLIHPESKRRGDKSQPGTLEHVFAITEDAEGNIWFGDRDTGAWKYDGKTMTNYVIGEGTQPMIWTIYKDRNNNLLFGREDGSILRFNGKSFEDFNLGSLQRITIQIEESYHQEDISPDEYLKERLSPIRANFKRINSIDQWSRVDTKELWESTEGGEAKYYFNEGQLEKISTRHFGETFQLLTEYYLLKGQLSFVFAKTYKYNRPMYYDSKAKEENQDTEEFDLEKSEIVEVRSYFEEGKLIHQLNNQDCGSPDSKDYLFQEQKRILSDFAKLMNLREEQ